ncbi:MAG: hypothetical protein ACFCUV_08955 [Rivularia sp. (in: cyanobacteria)]
MKKPLGYYFIPITIIIVIAFFLGSSARLSCKKLEPSHTQCQLKRFRMFGLISTSEENFRLTKADVETHINRDSEGDYTIYKLVLYEKDVPIQFYKHVEFNYLGNDAQSDRERINKFLKIEDEKAILNIYCRSYVKEFKGLIEMIIKLTMFVIVITIFSAIISVFKK